jgi:hypothetical protein
LQTPIEALCLNMGALNEPNIGNIPIQTIALTIEGAFVNFKRSVQSGLHPAIGFRLLAGINVPILRRIWIRSLGASMGAYLLYVPIDATDENGFKDKQDGYIFSCR